MKTPREILLNQHKVAESKLDAIRKEVVAAELHNNRESIGFGATLWRELIFPCRRIWAGLAGAWVVLLALNYSGGQEPNTVASKPAAPRPEVVAALREQRQLLARLLEAPPPSPATRPNVPGPRGAAPQIIRFG